MPLVEQWEVVMKQKNNFFNFPLNEIEKILELNSLKKSYATVIFKSIYQKNITSFLKIPEIKKENAKIINQIFTLKEWIKIKKSFVEKENGKITSIKFLVQIEENCFIENVLMNFNYGWSLCVSTQIGCNMGCKFCASTLNKKKRNLETFELVQQVLLVNKYLQKKFNQTIKNIVIMGIGEPFDNYENVINFLSIITSHFSISIPESKITVSTCGICDKIEKFATDASKINLAISFHAPNDKIRNTLMPINQKYNMQKLIKSIKKYQLLNKNKPVTIEYLLLKGINDDISNAKQLLTKLKGINFYINLISYNKNKEHNFLPSDNIELFKKFFEDNSIKVTIRLKRGKKINASCGQLRNKYEL
ncbi:MAG: 23S rRNA (adenine(2503)-C(2))-methyltransferase RlmN [Mycoplasmataceae bacterium]|nr:23S rRNA (adenine(2503)-C(2))-methyltransferase RlmN [Mycoplasmataceae bacterium]